MPRHDDPTSADAAAAPSHHPLDQGALRHVLGYQISLADIPSKKLFFRYIGEPLRLRLGCRSARLPGRLRPFQGPRMGQIGHHSPFPDGCAPAPGAGSTAPNS